MKPWKIVLTILLTAAICSVIGYGYGRWVTLRSTPVADTVRIRDTVRDSIPYPVIETVVQEIPELFPVYITLDAIRSTRQFIFLFPYRRRNTKQKTIVLGYLVISRHWIASGYIRKRSSSGRNLADGGSV